jgi:mono/diheme cytochrome c family protein
VSRARVQRAAAVAAGALAAVGLAQAVAARRALGPLQAEAQGLALEVRRAVWLDHAQAERSAAAHALMPGMPDLAFRRLAVSLSLVNRAPEPRRFAWQDLALRGRSRDAFAASPDGRGAVTVPPGHALLVEAAFDVPASDEPLSLVWEGGGARRLLLATASPVHAAPRVAPAEWPHEVTSLPPGDAAEGRRLFVRHACSSCHGEGAAPSLARIGADAAARTPGLSGPQYLYESIVDRPALVAATCRDCAPSRMPTYGEVLSVEEAAHLVAYLLAQRGTP